MIVYCLVLSPSLSPSLVMKHFSWHVCTSPFDILCCRRCGNCFLPPSPALLSLSLSLPSYCIPITLWLCPPLSYVENDFSFSFVFFSFVFFFAVVSFSFLISLRPRCIGLPFLSPSTTLIKTRHFRLFHFTRCSHLSGLSVYRCAPYVCHSGRVYVLFSSLSLPSFLSLFMACF